MKMKLENNRKIGLSTELKVMEVTTSTATTKVLHSRPKSITKPSLKGALEGVEKIWHLNEPTNMPMLLLMEEH